MGQGETPFQAITVVDLDYPPLSYFVSLLSGGFVLVLEEVVLMNLEPFVVAIVVSLLGSVKLFSRFSALSPQLRVRRVSLTSCSFLL